jgi:hypothetical protein
MTNDVMVLKVNGSFHILGVHGMNDFDKLKIKYHPVTPQTAFRMIDWLHKPTRCLFSELCPHLHAFRETSQKVTPPSQARLTVEFLWSELPKRGCILLV